MPDRRQSYRPRRTDERDAKQVSTTSPAASSLSDSIERYAMKYLARFGMATKQHLRTKIGDKVARLGFSADDNACTIELVLEKLEKAGLLNDLEAANLRIRRLKDRGWSLAHMRQDLIRRGISKEDLDKLFGTSRLDRNLSLEWQAAVRLAQRRKLGPWRADASVGEDAARLRKELRVFAARGFSYAMARRIIESQSQEDLLA